MRTIIGVYTGPESYGGRTAMAGFCSLPSFQLGEASDSKIPDEQAASEASITLLEENIEGWAL